jgi:hypothetical protein
MTASAWISEDRAYRYALLRSWEYGTGFVAFVGLNPSTADENTDDPTIRRCIRFAKDWGYSGLLMANLFAYRATKPKDMMSAKDPVGPLNDRYLQTISTKAGLVIAAWGADGGWRGRDKQVRAMVPGMKCLHLTKDGHPGHPLYLPASSLPMEMPK